MKDRPSVHACKSKNKQTLGGLFSMNATLKKFGYPGTLVREYEHWVVLLRPQQATLGALVLICKEDANALPKISVDAFLELKEVTTVIEASLNDCFIYDKINYLMLMMVDPDVHFHVLPRYSDFRVWEHTEFADPGWPGPPVLGQTNEVSDVVTQQMQKILKIAFCR
jgi:diadenosine tetraphosphate (Ap4A) HIT family hydrolase